ncbi:hypothetical protein [Paludibacterium yongneupense]|uniref:hypothetical protein n=1 Tax=Paludibacterium yongneupense TaxID=400061 RepID=UPI0012EC8D05|nr:hypothetical protein [Paludibacterium yongneupense]
MLPLLAGAAALVCLGAAMSWLLAPAPFVRWSLTAPAPRAAVARITAQHWFGEVVRRQETPPPLSVVGVYAPQGASPGFVIVDEGGHETSLVVGATTAGGWTLKRVTADGAVMSSADGERLLSLLAARSATASPPGAPAPGSMSSSDILQPPPPLPAPGTP